MFCNKEENFSSIINLSVSVVLKFAVFLLCTEQQLNPSQPLQLHVILLKASLPSLSALRGQMSLLYQSYLDLAT